MKFSDDRVQAIIKGARAFRVLAFPGAPVEANVQVAVRLLTEAELDGCRLEAQQQLRTFCDRRPQKWDPTTAVDMDPGLIIRYQEQQLVMMAFYDADTINGDKPRRFFETLDQVRTLDATTMTRLREAYEQHQEWVAPLKSLQVEEIKEMVASLGNESSASVQLHQFDRNTLVRCVLSLASALRSST